jgi:hypothetical protein
MEERMGRSEWGGTNGEGGGGKTEIERRKIGRGKERERTKEKEKNRKKGRGTYSRDKYRKVGRAERENGEKDARFPSLFLSIPCLHIPLLSMLPFY